MQSENNVHHIFSVLNNKGTVLLPVDGIWGLACTAGNELGINKITNINPQKNNLHFEILVSDIGMLKKMVSHLHPRIETLLVYHERPLKIYFPNFKALPDNILNVTPVYFRLVKDHFIQRLIVQLSQPLFICSFLDESKKFTLPFDQIELHKLPSPDFIKQPYEQ